MTKKNKGEPPISKVRQGPGRTVYIGLRQWTNGKARYVPGGSIRAIDFTAQEVHDIIVDALRTAAARAQLVDRAQQKGSAHADHARKL